MQNGKLIGIVTNVLVSNPKIRFWSICRFSFREYGNLLKLVLQKMS
jgi:hypothetical protein